MRYVSYSIALLFVCAAGFNQQAWSQFDEEPFLQEPELQTGVEGAGGFDSVMQIANQAFMALQNRQFAAALQGYQNAASSNPEYQKMVDFCNAILDRLEEITEMQFELFAKTQAPDFRIEQLTREEIDQMLDFQIRSMQAGQAFQELGLLVDIPVLELGLDFEGADQTTLGEYLGWVPPRGANQRIWNLARRRALERQRVYAKQEILVQQRQERLQRIEEYRRARLERQGGQLGGGLAGGGMMGGGMMGGGMMGGGMMGGGMMGGGMGGFGGGMGGGFGGGMMGF